MDKNNIKYILGQRIKEERNKIGLSQKELAEKIGKSIGNVSGYEIADRLPPVDVLCNMADIFNCTTDYLLGRTNRPDTEIIEGKVNGHKIEAEVIRRTGYNTVETTLNTIEELLKLIRDESKPTQ